MSIPILRPYQGEQIERIRTFYKGHPNGKVIMQAPTGSGKTIMFTYMALCANKKQNRVTIFSNRTELMNQTGGAFEKFGIIPTYINPSVRTPSFKSMATSAMLQTLRRRFKQPEWIRFMKMQDFFIIDECHLGDAQYLIESGLLDGRPVLGATATPIRSGNQPQLGLFYDEIVKGAQVRELVSQGWLVPERYFGVDGADVTKVPYDKATGDYQRKALYNVFNSREQYTGVVDNYRTNTDGTKALCFCVNQMHAVKTAVEFHRAGISTMFLTSGKSMPKKPAEWKNEAQRVKYEDDYEIYKTLKQYSFLTGNRGDVLKDYNHNKFKALINVDMLTTGYDQKDIETIIINRKTLSLQLYLQMLGRGSRINPETGKILFNTLDFGNHAGREEYNFGRYMDDRDWDLWHLATKGGGIAPKKVCDPEEVDFRGIKGCGRIIPTIYKVCPFCGHTFPTKKQEREVELKEQIYSGEIDEEVLIKNMNYKQLKAFRELKRYSPVWLGRILYARGGVNEIKKGMREMGYGYGYIYRIIGMSEKWGKKVK